MPDDYVVVLTTLPADGDSAGLATILVQERLVACVNILPPMKSIYRWADGIEDATEHQLVLKTTQTQVPALQQRIRDLHPYDVPEFVVLSIVDGSDSYLAWLTRMTRTEADDTDKHG